MLKDFHYYHHNPIFVIMMFYLNFAILNKTTEFLKSHLISIQNIKWTKSFICLSLLIEYCCGSITLHKWKKKYNFLKPLYNRTRLLDNLSDNIFHVTLYFGSSIQIDFLIFKASPWRNNFKYCNFRWYTIFDNKVWCVVL